MSESANENYRLPFGRCVCYIRKLVTTIKNFGEKGKGIKVLRTATPEGLCSMLVRSNIFTCKIISFHTLVVIKFLIQQTLQGKCFLSL